MKHNKYILVISTIFALSLTSCSKNPNEVIFNIDDINVIDIHTEFQNEYLNSSDPDGFVYNHKSELATFSNSAPNKYKVTYIVTNDLGIEAKSTWVEISEHSDMSNSYRFDGEKDYTYINNLKVNYKYYLTVNASFKTTFTSEVKEFTTKDTKIRNLDVEGVENVRDLGGYKLEGGKTYKQGMIYRTAQYNYGGRDNEFVSAPTEAGKKVLLEQLGIKTDIDLRRTKDFDGNDEVNGITSSPLGINYISCPMVFGGKNIYTQSINRDSLKLFFDSLAVESNYPIAFHCIRGTDRTGGLAYALGALLGMSKEDLMLDYLFSNFAKITSTANNVVRANGIKSLYVKGIDDSEGSTLSEKARNYLITKTGVESSTLDTIIDLLTE